MWKVIISEFKRNTYLFTYIIIFFCSLNISVNAIVIEDSIPLTAPKVIGKQSKNKCHSLRKYLEIKDDNVFCLLCQVKYSKNTGISTIKKHFSNFHEEAYKEAMKEAVNVEPYTEKDSKKVELINSQLYEWIICDQQPFNVVENNEFQNWGKGVMSIFTRTVCGTPSGLAL